MSTQQKEYPIETSYGVVQIMPLSEKKVRAGADRASPLTINRVQYHGHVYLTLVDGEWQHNSGSDYLKRVNNGDFNWRTNQYNNLRDHILTMARTWLAFHPVELWTAGVVDRNNTVQRAIRLENEALAAWNKAKEERAKAYEELVEFSKLMPTQG